MYNQTRAFSKRHERVKNPKLLEHVRDQPCLVCKIKGVDVHHVKSKGAYGDDVENNVVPLCREHHTEVHKIGLNRFSEKYKDMSIWLSRNGWEFDSFVNKWRCGNK